MTIAAQVTLDRDYPDSVAALVAIARAARSAGDTRLERAARRQLADRYGIRLSAPSQREATR